MALQNSLLPVPRDSTKTIPPAPAGQPTGELTQSDIERIQKTLDLGTSENTRAMYNSAWRSFQTWANNREVRAMPASPALIAAYLSHLAEDRHLSVGTIRLHQAALAAMHKAAGQQDPTDNEGVRRLLKGISRAHGKAPKQAKPLTAEALAAVKATVNGRRSLGGRGKGHESAETASWRARVDVALLSVLRDGLLRRSEAAALTWADVELRDDGAALLQIRRSKTDPDGEGVVLYVGSEAAAALQAIRPAEQLVPPGEPVFGLCARQIGRRV